MPEFSLDIPRMGYFILYRHTKGFLGDQIIKQQLANGFPAEDARFTHVEVAGGGPWTVRVAPPKTKICDIRKIYPGRWVKIVRYKNADYEARRRLKVAFWAASLCNLPYDIFGVLRFKFKLLFGFKGAFFCSESCAWSLYKEFPSALGKRPEDCMPADFANPDFFEKVWEGELPNAFEPDKETDRHPLG